MLAPVLEEGADSRATAFWGSFIRRATVVMRTNYGFCLLIGLAWLSFSTGCSEDVVLSFGDAGAFGAPSTGSSDANDAGALDAGAMGGQGGSTGDASAVSDAGSTGDASAVSDAGNTGDASETEEVPDARVEDPDSGSAPVLTVLVTNDDGVGADGIDLMVEELRKLPRVEVVVVAPATNRSATGSLLTNGPVQHESSATKSGFPAVAVHGYPADTINVALDELGVEPDFVIAGTNEGVNAGLLIDLSGTIGAARQAAKRGIPALAVSQERIDGRSDFAASVRVALDWFDAKRAAIEAGALPTSTIVNINAPTCAPGTTMRGAVEVPLAWSVALFPSNCASTVTTPADDVAAITHGYASVTPDVPVP